MNSRPDGGLEADGAIGRRPRDLALLLLAIGGGPPRQRARDQQADLAGLELHRRVLDRLAALDPEPEECEAALSRIVAEFGDPTGPTRGVCLRVRQEWEECRDTASAWSWLLKEALDSGDGVPGGGGDVGPKALLDRWIGRPAPSPALAAALADLGRLGVDRPELLEAAKGLAALLVAAFDDLDPPSNPATSPGAMAECWSSGRPAFQVHPPRLDRATLANRLRRLVEALGPGNESAPALARAVRSRSFDPMPWAGDVLAGRPEDLAARAEGLGLDPSLVASTLRLTLLPSLARISLGWNLTRPEGAWSRGDCPHCGSRPLLAESRGLEQGIHHRCGLCAADWPGERLGCPSCGESSPKALHLSFVEGEQERYRLAHCDACRFDWKVVSTLTALTPPAMIVADLATVHLDLLADDRRGELP